MEAFEGHWRKVPSVKRLVFKTVPDPTTRAAMLKNGEVDVAYMLDAPAALELKRDPAIRLGFSGAIGVHYLDFFDQWDPKSPWHDRRVRLAANHAVDRRGLSEAETLGASRPTGSMVPRTFDFALPLEPYAYDPAKAKQLLAEAGYPNGFDGGDFYPYPPYWSAGETIIGYFGAVGIRMRLRTMERAAFQSAWGGKKLRGVCMCTMANFGNAATRLADAVQSDGAYAPGGGVPRSRSARAASMRILRILMIAVSALPRRSRVRSTMGRWLSVIALSCTPTPGTPKNLRVSCASQSHR